MTGQVSIDVDYLACPVCLDVPTDAILMCSHGHNICSECFKKLCDPKTCPKCRQPFDEAPLRNYSVEQLIAHLPSVELMCKYSEWGCNEFALKEKLEDHEKGCSFKPFKCPLQHCHAMLATKTFSAHFLEQHTHDLDFFKSTDKNTLILRTPVGEPHHPHRICVWSVWGIPFIRFWEPVPGKDVDYVWMAVAGNESEAKKYDFEIALQNEHIGPAYKYKGPVHSIDKRLDFVSRTALGMPLTNDVILRYQIGEPVEKKDNLKYPRLCFTITITKRAAAVPHVSSCPSMASPCEEVATLSVPFYPSAPSGSSAPSDISASSAPLAPSAPSDPSYPSAPFAPSAPPAPSGPSAPSTLRATRSFPHLRYARIVGLGLKARSSESHN